MTVVERLRNRGVTPRAVLYARFSSDNQREESIEAQLRAMHEYCSRNSIVIIHEYCDRAKSATTDDRPEFLKMIAASREEYFESTLSRPTITIQSTPRAYGHFSLREDTWISKLGGTHEINLGAGTINRSIEFVVATLLHEMVHYYNYINGVQDCSRGNTYHNKRFKAAAEARGLIVEHSDKYGWSHTSPGDSLLQFCLDNDLSDILINRNEFSGFQMPGTGAHNGGVQVITPKKPSSTRKYLCPCCGNSVRATKVVRIGCLDCGTQMLEV